MPRTPAQFKAKHNKKLSLPAAKHAAATIAIKRPGAMHAKGRAQIAAWMRKQAAALVKDGKDYNDKGNFVAKYMHLEGN